MIQLLTNESCHLHDRAGVGLLLSSRFPVKPIFVEHDFIVLESNQFGHVENVPHGVNSLPQ